LGDSRDRLRPCYHQACDTYANNNDFALDHNSDAVARVTLVYAMSTTEINGLKGKGNFQKEQMPYLGDELAR
jgi:hypothetical protein